MGVRHVHRRALVADVDDAHAEPGELVPDGLDVAALEAEHAIHAVVAQEARDQVGDDGPALGRLLRHPIPSSMSDPQHVMQPTHREGF